MLKSFKKYKKVLKSVKKYQKVSKKVFPKSLTKCLPKKKFLNNIILAHSNNEIQKGFIYGLSSTTFKTPMLTSNFGKTH